MNGSPRLELAVEVILLIVGVAYLIVMLGYPRNAGIVPAIAAVVMIGAVIVQIAHRLHRRHAEQASRSPGEGLQEVSGEETFDGLIGEPGMNGAAKRRLVTAMVWTLATVFAVQLVGFVVGAVLLVAVFLLVTRQPVHIILATCVVVGVGVFLLTDIVIGIPWTTAPLLEEFLG